MFSGKLDIGLVISVVFTCVNLNKINVHVKNLKIKNQPVPWFGLTELNKTMGDSSQFSPLATLSAQLGPNSWVSSVFIPAFIANIGKHFFLKYDSEYSKSI